MSRQRYQAALAELRTEVVLMAELVCDRYSDTLAAAASGDRRRAEQLIALDADVNSRYLELESRCLDLIARQQPVASDLRLITASFKILTDLERIADLAVNLAGHIRDGGEIHPAVEVDSLGGVAGDMVTTAVEAYEQGDTEACHAVAAREESFDADCHAVGDRIVRDLLSTDAKNRAYTRTAEAASRGLLIVRDLERVGDHAVNIAARVLYMIDTDDALL